MSERTVWKKHAMSYKLAIFDFDGTLADTVPWFASVINRVADRYGFKQVAERDHEMLRGFGPHRLLEVLDVPLWKVPAIAYHVRRLMAQDIDHISLFDGVDELLRTLSQAGVRLGLVSSNSRQNVHRTLGPDNVALIDAFSCGVSLFGKASKLRGVLDACSVAREDTIYVGDEVRDIEAAREVGVASGAVSWGYNTVEALSAYDPTELFNSVDEILQVILACQ